MSRKIVQIATTPATTQNSARVFALCSDGTLWVKDVSTNIEDWELQQSPPTAGVDIRDRGYDPNVPRTQ